MLGKIFSRRHFEKKVFFFFFFFSKKKKKKKKDFDIPCKLSPSPKETICIKVNFPGENKKNIN